MRSCPAQQAGQVGQFAVQAVDLGHHALGVGEDHAALGGQLDSAARAVEHVDAQLGVDCVAGRNRRTALVEVEHHEGPLPWMGIRGFAWTAASPAPGAPR